MVVEVPAGARVVEVMPGAQAEFVLSEAAYPAYIAGRRGGKTSASVIKMVRYMMSNPGAYFMFTVPTLGDVDRILLPKMREFFGAFYGQLWEWHEKKAQFVFPGHRGKDGEGGIVFVRPALEPDQMRGPTLAAAAMDEIAIGDQYAAFDILLKAVHGGQSGFPHQLWVTTTPRDSQAWIAKIWRDRLNPDDDYPLPPEDFPTFRAKTVDNFHLDPASIQMMYRTGSKRDHLQELEGEFLSLEGTVLPMLKPEIHLKYPPADAEFVRTVFGFDIGGTAPTAAIQWKQDRQGNKYAVAEYYRASADEYDWTKWLADHNAQRVMCDPAIGEKVLRYWRRKYGVNFVPARDKTHEGRLNVWMTGLGHDIHPPSIFISPDCPRLWDELLNLRRKKKGEDDYSEKQWASGCSDHAFDAGAYGLQEFEGAGAQGRPAKMNIRR